MGIVSLLNYNSRALVGIGQWDGEILDVKIPARISKPIMTNHKANVEVKLKIKLRGDVTNLFIMHLNVILGYLMTKERNRVKILWKTMKQKHC